MARPGWRPGRIALTWHLVFPDSTPLARHVAAYQRAFDGLPGIDPVPAEWLHLTVQAVGWADEIPATTVSAVVAAVRARVSTLAPFDLVFDRPTIYGEAAAIRSDPDAPVARLRETVRAGLRDVLGDDGVPTAPEQARGFLRMSRSPTAASTRTSRRTPPRSRGSCDRRRPCPSPR